MAYLISDIDKLMSYGWFREVNGVLHLTRLFTLDFQEGWVNMVYHRMAHSGKLGFYFHCTPNTYKAFF